MKAFDAIVANKVSAKMPVRLIGPVSAAINSPEACLRALHLCDYLLNESLLSGKTQELAILVAVRELGCSYVWSAHVPRAIKAGVSQRLVEMIRDDKNLSALEPDEEATIKYGREFFRTHQVTQETFDSALKCFGARGLVELTMLMSHFSTKAFLANAFEVDRGELPFWENISRS